MAVVTLHQEKRARQNAGKCDAPDCDGGGPLYITIATGHRGAPGNYEANHACSWPCAIAVVRQRHLDDLDKRGDLYMWECE